MTTFVEIRVPEKWATQVYGSSLGQSLLVNGEPFVRRIVLESTDPRLAELKVRLKRDHKKPAVLIERVYMPQEVASAQLFQLFITNGLQDVCGEDFGTQYDDKNACPRCGAGRIQRSPLKLDLSLIPEGLDIANSIALNEWVVSQRLVELMEALGITGYCVQQVEHIGKSKPKMQWHQLIVTGSAGRTIAPTHFGINYFEEDTDGDYICAEHMLSGLHIVSEVFVSRKTLDNVDIALTANRVGRRSGVLMPAPMILISPRLHQLVTQHMIQACKVEIAHIVE